MSLVRNRRATFSELAFWELCHISVHVPERREDSKANVPMIADNLAQEFWGVKSDVQKGFRCKAWILNGTEKKNDRGWWKKRNFPYNANWTIWSAFPGFNCPLVNLLCKCELKDVSLTFELILNIWRASEGMVLVTFRCEAAGGVVETFLPQRREFLLPKADYCCSIPSGAFSNRFTSRSSEGSAVLAGFQMVWILWGQHRSDSLHVQKHGTLKIDEISSDFHSKSWFS